MRALPWCVVVAALWCLIQPSLAWADDGLVIRSPQLNGESLSLGLDILEDEGGAYTLEQVTSPPLSKQFQRSQQQVPGLGLTTSAYWFRFKVDNRREQSADWLLEIAYSPLDDVRLFVPRADGGFDVKLSGDHVPFALRDVKYRNPLFELAQPPGVRTYYLRVQTAGSLSLPLRAWSAHTFIEHLTIEQPPLWIFYGLMLVMAAYNLFVYLSVREKAYLYYVCYIVSYIGLQFSLNGFAFQYLWPNQSWWNDKTLLLCLYFGFGFGLLFQREFLTLGRTFPRLDRCGKVMTWVTFLLSGASLVLSYAIAIRLLVFWGVAVIVFVLAATGFAASTRSRPAMFYAAAWLALLIGILFFLLRSLGLVADSFFTVWGPQLGASIEVTLLSLGLADRINVMRANLQVLNLQLTGNVTHLTHALEQAEAATRAKGEFLASVSHELRTPLNAIVNIPEGLLEDFHEASALSCTNCEAIFALGPAEKPDYAQPCPECRAEGTLRARQTWIYEGDAEASVRHLGSIRKVSKHLLGVVSSILDFSKLEAARMELELADVDLADLLDDTISPLKQLAESKGVRLTVVPVSPDSRVRGDQLRIAQIVVNLVANAIKFSDGRGDVLVEVQSEPDACVIRVRDHGIGIALGDRERIFESFHQVDSSNTRKFGGTGLGLAISKHLVELHGGSIWVDSEFGKGSTFSIRLPKAGPPSPAAVQGAQASYTSKRPSSGSSSRPPHTGAVTDSP